MMKNLFKSMNIIRCVSGANLNLFRYTAMVIMLLTLGVGNAWATGGGGTTYYSKVTVSGNPTGAGSVYVKAGSSFSGTKTSDTNNGTDKSHTYSIKATANTGYEFKSWSGSSVTITTATSASTTCTINATSEKENNPTTGSATATFVKIFQFKAKADFTTGSASGKVWVSFTNGTPAYQASAMTDTGTQKGDDANTASKTKTAYFSAQAPTGTEFKGWYSDAAGTNKVSDNASYSPSITSSVIEAPSNPQLTLYAKFEKVETTPYWSLSGIVGTSKTLQIGETIDLLTETDGNSYSWGTPSYVDAGETNPVMTYNSSTKTFTANRAGTVTVTFTQAAGEDANGVLWKAGSETFTFTVNKLTPQFAWADPLPNFVVGTSLAVSNLFSFSPAECEQNWTLTSSDPTNLPSIAAPATTLSLPKEVNGVTLTFHQDATWKWNEIANTSIKINVTKEPVTFNWKNPALIAGNTYSWADFVETNSAGAWNLVSDDESIIPTMRSIASTSGMVAAGTVTLTFTQGQDLAHDAVPVQTKTFRVYPADGLATFKVGSTTYTDLNAANSAASSASNKTIVVARDGVLLPGNYTISNGVTLYIPYSTSETTLTAPAYTYFSSGTPESPSCYRKLTLLDGANITVNSGGVICVGGQIASLGGGSPSGYPFGACGVLDMSNGGHIELNGTLYAWGFVKGQDMDQGNNTVGVGTITANANSKVYEDFCGENRGGSACSALASDGISYKSFPFQGYAIQNIEVPVTYKYQSTLQVYTALYIQGAIKKDFPLISSSGSLFLVQNSTSHVKKWYDPTTDLACYELSGTAKLDAINTTIYVSVNSADFNLPISSNMHIILDNCTMTLSNPVQILPDAVIEIKANSTATISSNMFLYDVDDWWQGIGAYYFASFKNLTTHKNRGDGTSKAKLNDAKLIVDGTLNVTGKLYSTSGGANICGNGGGTITFSSLPSASNIYQCWGAVNGSATYNSVAAVKTFSSWTGGKTYLHSVAVNSANLHNENGVYTKSIASKTFHNVHGRWFVAADKDPKENHTYSFTYLDNGNAGSDANTPAVYSSDKTGLMAGYKWVNVALDNAFCGSKTYKGIDGHYYYYNNASTDAVSKWVQLVKLNDALYSGSDNNLYTFTTTGCSWASVGEIDENCMYTVDGVKKALVGTEFVALEKDEYDEVYVKVTDHSDYYMLFDGCVWQHATKIPNTYRAYEVLDNPYIWLNDEWTQVEEEFGYYYITDDQNVKHYYEFDEVTFSWQPAKETVRITTPAGDRKDFLTWDMAMAYLNQYIDPTVTLLDDAIATQSVATLAPNAKSTEFTFDLNGHTLTANIGDAAYFMNMNTTAKLYITDNSDKANGQMLIYGNGNKKISGLNVTKGNVVMNGGRIYMENAAVYASNTSCQAAAINLVAGQTFEINDGELEAKAHRNAVGVYGASSAATATTSKITMNGGSVKATAPNYAYGILSYGIINMNGGTIDAKTAAVTSAGGTTAAGSYAYGIYGHASVSAVDANSYYSTINMTGGTLNATAYSQYAYGIYGYSIYTTANGKKSDGTSDNTYKPTDGTYSNKASCKLNITGGTINAIAERSYYSYGIYSAGTYNSYKDYNTSTKKITITPHTIKNVKVFSQATATAYGILMSAQAHEYSGGLLWGEAVIDDADVYAETTVSTNAYAVYASATNIWTNRARYSQVSASNKKTWYVQANNNDGDVTHEGIAATTTQVYQYQIGCHVAGAKITINSGNYRAKSANSTSAYGVYCNRSTCPGDPTGNTAGVAEVTINGGTFTAETMTDTGYGISNGGITTVNGGTINVHTGTSTAYGVYCWAGTLTLNSSVVINSTVETTTAYGVAANGWIDGSNTGLHTHGEVIVNEGVIVNVTAPNSTTAYGVYALATNAELNQTKYNARSDNDKKNYYAVNEEGTTVTNATVANYIPYRFGTYTEGGEITINGGTFNVTTFGSTAIGAGTSLSNLVRTTELGRVKVGRGVLNVHSGTFNIESETSSTAEGIRSYGITNVDGGTFNIQTKTTTAYGVCVHDGKTTIDGGTFNVTAGTSTAVGVSAWAEANEFNTDYGYYYTGDVEVNGGTFNVKTWNGSEAYGVQVRGTTKNFAAAKVKIDGVADTKKDYAIAGTATINGGTFIMTPSNGTKAYSTHVYTTQTLGTATAYPTCYIKGGFFQTNGTTTSGMYVSAFKENNVVTGGHFSDNTGLTSTTATKNYVNDPYHVLNCVHPDYKSTYPYEVAEAYTITFKDDAGNTLWSGLQPKGSTAVYPLTNGIPERGATATNSFEFASWDTPLAEVTADAIYTASFNTVAKKFMVTWKDDKGVEIDHMEYASGSTPAHADPVKEGYTFTGWTPAITAVGAADQTYTATFSINQYTIRFEDEDGTLIDEKTVNYGTTPTKPANPTKEGYSFSAWNPGIVKATEDVTYTATYLLNIASVTTSAGKTTPYTAWSTALSAANGAANSTLTLLTDVGGLGSAQAITQTFTLDLNGHTLSGTANKLINVNKAGKTLTIRDSQGGGKIVTKSATSQLIAVCVTAGTLNIESGLIRAENTYTSTNTSYYGCGVWVVSGYACNMSGGTVEGITNIDVAYGIYNNGGTVNITGGTINAEAQTKAYGVVVKGNTTVENDAVVNASTTRTTIADVFYVTAADKTLTINGGVFTANALTTAGYAIEATAAATINVNGGKFKSSAKTVSNTGETPATIHLNAGFYDTDTELAGFASPKKVVGLTTEPEKAEGYDYKIVDDAHQVTFKNEDGSIVLQQSNIEDGVQPVYFGEAQTKLSTPKYSYSFDGWMDASDGHVYAEAELPVVSKDAVYTAHFVQQGVPYPITFANIDGMGTNHVQMVTYGEVPVYNGATPYMSGAVSNYAYTFIGWDPELAVVEGPATYTPRYDLVISHNVSFVINNVSATTPAALTVAEGAAVERPADQLVNCQHIAGWYTDGGLTEEWDFTNDKMGDHDIILYAKWETKTYTITWLDENADEIDQTTVDCGTIPTHADLYKPSTAACSYEWKGWNKTLVAANANATYKSLGFTQVPKRYAITFVTGSGATVINPIEQEVGSIIEAPADPTREGYTFNGWLPAVPSTMPANDVTCVAQWTVNTHKLVWNFDGGTSSGNYTEANNALAYGSAITYPALSKTGYTFAGWSTNATSMPDADLTITASWTPNTNTAYTVKHYKQKLDGTYASTPDETDNLTGTTATEVTPAVKSYEGFDAPSTQKVTILADGSQVVTYQYIRKSYNLSWVTDGDALTGTYTHGSTKFGAAIIAPNTPTKTGYDFASWDAEVASTMPAENMTYAATWTIKQYTLTVQAKDPSMGTVTGGGEYDYNSVHTIKATPNAGFKFVQWNDGNENAERSVTIPAENVTYTATFDYDIANYTVKHWQQNIYDDDYTEITGDQQVLSGTIGATTAAVAKSYTGFTAQKFSQGTIVAGGSTEVNIYYNRNTYTITWKDGTETIKTEPWKYGATPAFAYEKPATAQYTYTLTGWSPEIAPVTEDATYTAQYNAVTRSYAITFVNDNGDVLKSNAFEYGDVPSYGDSNPVSSHADDGDGFTYTFAGWEPALAAVNGDKTYTATYNRSVDSITVSTNETITVNTNTSTTTTVIKNEGTLTVGGDTLQSNTIIVEAGGQLDVTEGGSIEAEVFIIQATTEEQGEEDSQEEVQVSGELSDTGTKNLQDVYYDLTRKHGTENFLARVWYAVAVPWAVEVPTYSNGGVYIKRGEDFIQQSLGATFDLLSYDGDCRAQNGAGADCWVYLEDEIEGGTPAVMVPGKLYMIYLTEETSTIRFKKKYGEAIHTNSLTVSAHNETSNTNDANWNGIANPATYRAYMNVNVGKDGLVQKFVPGTQPRDGGRYLPIDLNDKQSVGQPFFVQVDPDEDPNVTATRTNPYAAPLRYAQASKEARYAIAIAANGKLADRLYIQTAEEKENGYEVGKDMSKMGVSSSVAQMWVDRYGFKLCLNTMTLQRSSAEYPLGIYAPQSGEYKIFAPAEMESGDNIYLTKDGRIIWNLTYAPYYASLDQGTNTQYGLRFVRSNPAVSTGVENTKVETYPTAQKILIDDKVYILREGEVYTVTGQKAN